MLKSPTKDMASEQLPSLYALGPYFISRKLSYRYRLHEFLCTAKLLKVAKFYSFLLSYSPNQCHDSVPLKGGFYFVGSYCTTCNMTERNKILKLSAIATRTGVAISATYFCFKFHFEQKIVVVVVARIRLFHRTLH